MTENETLKTLEDLQRLLTNYRHISKELTEANGMAIQSLEEIQQYRELGTAEEILKVLNNQQTIIAAQHETLKQYRAIGTTTEFKALKEKMHDVEIMIIDRMQEFYDEYRSISQSRVDHFGGKADAIKISQQIVKGVFKDILGIDWQ